jgi:hypothetical protein
MKCFFQRLWNSRRWRFSIIILVVGIVAIFACDMANENGLLFSERTYLDGASWQIVRKTEILGIVVSEAKAEELPFAELARGFRPSFDDGEVIVAVRPLGCLKSRFSHGRLLGSVSDLKQLSSMLGAEPENRDEIEKKVLLVLASMRDSIGRAGKSEK